METYEIEALDSKYRKVILTLLRSDIDDTVRIVDVQKVETKQ